MKKSWIGWQWILLGVVWFLYFLAHSLCFASATKGLIGKEDQRLYDGISTTFTRKTSTGGTATYNKIETDAVDVLQVYGDGSTKTEACVNLAISQIGSRSAIIRLTPGTWTFSNDVTFSANSILKMDAGVIIDVLVGVVVTLPKNIKAGDYQIFSGAGDFDFLDGTELLVSWCGTLAKALVWIETEAVTLKATNSFSIDTAETVDSNITLDINPGSIIDGAGSLVVNGAFKPKPYQMFDSVFDVTFGDLVPYINIEWWGGGVGAAAATNDTAFAKALTTHNVINFYPGTYDFTDGVTATAPIYLHGVGMSETELSFTGTGDFITVTLPTWVRGGLVEGLKLTSSDAVNSILVLNKTWRVVVRDCEFASGGTAIEVGEDSYAAKIERVRMQLFSVYGVFCHESTTDVTIKDCDIAEGDGAIGIHSAGDNLVIENNWFESGSSVNAIAHITHATGSGSMIIAKNRFGHIGDTGGDFIQVESGKATNISNNLFIASGCPAGNSVVISTSDIFTTIIMGNSFYNTVNEFIDVTSGTVIINGNSFYASSPSVVSATLISASGGVLSINNNNFRSSAAANIHAAVGGGSSYIRQFSNNNIYNMGGVTAYTRQANGNTIDCRSGGASGIYVTSGGAVGNKIDGCNVGIFAASGAIVNANNILTCTTPISTSGTGLQIGNNGSADIETLTTDAQTLRPWGVTYFDTTSGALGGTLSSGKIVGVVKTTVMSVDNGDYTLSVLSHETSDPETFVFANVDETLVLIWTGTEWATIKSSATP